MKILNFGSLNIDYVYRVDTFVLPGETKSCKSLLVNPGGKGLNQSIAAAKAGNQVWHAGIVGRDGGFLAEILEAHRVGIQLMEHSTEVSGHAIIQVDDAGQNCILLYGGTNQLLTEAYIDRTLEAFGNEGLVLLQNETNLVGYIIAQAHARGLQVALNSAPMNAAVLAYPLHLLDWLIVNEVEGCQIAGCERDTDVLQILGDKFPGVNILLTLGKQGACCLSDGKTNCVNSYNVKVVDSTAAGDTFTGYFLYGILNGYTSTEAMKFASAAAALCVQRQGASGSVPARAEVEAALVDGRLGDLVVKL